MEQKQREILGEISQIPILITSSITPHDTGVKLLDPEQRLFHALEAIEQWIRITPKSRFVLCDGSSFDFAPITRERFPDTQIECLYFENDQLKITKFGRGFGEGEIVKFALKHSLYLREAEIFVKCSSKLWVDNYFDCLTAWRADCLFSGLFKNYFSLINKLEMIQVDTRFYVVENKFYSANLIDAHLRIDLSTGFGIEDIFFQIMLLLKQKRYLFCVHPVINGVGGGIGKYYKVNWGRRLKEKIKILIAKKSRRFSDYFPS